MLWWRGPALIRHSLPRKKLISITILYRFMRAECWRNLILRNRTVLSFFHSISSHSDCMLCNPPTLTQHSPAGVSAVSSALSQLNRALPLSQGVTYLVEEFEIHVLLHHIMFPVGDIVLVL